LQIQLASDHYRDVTADDELRFTDPSRSLALIVEPFEMPSKHSSYPEPM